MRGSARAVVLSIALLGVGVFTGVWAVLWLLRGSYLTALIVCGVTVWAVGFATYFLATTVGKAKPRLESGSAGTILRPGRFVDAAFVLATGTVFVAAVLYLIFAPLGMVDYVPTGVMQLAVPGGCVALVLFGAPTLYRMARHGGGGHLRVDPAGFEVWNGQWGTLRRGTWDEIEDITDHPAKGGKPFNEVIVFALPKGRTAVLIADAITGDVAALREWVRFYWRHPQHRDELGDGRALQRLGQGCVAE
ncbi:hypothetical protein SAMN04489835_1901 [Mycolicibacterium rutilum]|uniref:Uncharacterized protein n=1 Tax=Mycolicibacterium rutilum TaxID=370526 RepID=A0A1H6JE89_MYCRU|nr:hypothetical protein [Mycolicibacterium rutilum]SEH60208.1 hypothetical protein SAMN04489835_1901 [Mycolicibacterium rutilum]